MELYGSEGFFLGGFFTGQVYVTLGFLLGGYFQGGFCQGADFREAFNSGGLFPFFLGGFISGRHISVWLFSRWLLSGGLFPKPNAMLCLLLCHPLLSRLQVPWYRISARTHIHFEVRIRCVF